MLGKRKQQKGIQYSKMVHWEVSRAIYRIADAQGVKFDYLPLDKKSEWLKENLTTVLNNVIAKNGSGWSGIKDYRISVVKGDGDDAVLFFEKVS